MLLEPLIREAARGMPLRPAPIPADWIESGSPEPIGAVLAKADDRGASVVLWGCAAGRFTWRYDCDETLYILDGGVTITAPGEPERRLAAGDLIHFSRGSVATWTIESHVIKLAFCRAMPPRLVSLALRWARGLLRRLRRPRATPAATLAAI